MVAIASEGKKSTKNSAAAKSVRKITPTKRPRVKKINVFEGNVVVVDQTGAAGKHSNPHFDNPQCYEKVHKISINAKMPSQQQRGKGNRIGARFFDPNAREKKWLKDVLRANLAVGYELMTGPVLVHVNYYYKIPQKNPTSIKKDDFYAKTPDVDHLQKFLFDVFSGVFYVDDCQVSYVTVCKQYDDHDHCEISIACRRDDDRSDDDDASYTTEEIEGFFFPEKPEK